MRNAETVELTTTKPETTFQEMLNLIEDGLSDLASSDDEADGTHQDDDEDDHGGSQQSKDDESGRVIGTISKIAYSHMERFRQKKIKLDKLTQPDRGDAADYFCERHTKYRTTELKVPVVAHPQTADDAASSAPTTLSEPLKTLVGVVGHLQMPQVTTRSWSSHMMLGLQKPQTHERIPFLTPATIPDWSQIQ